jgi:hypothetical protein
MKPTKTPKPTPTRRSREAPSREQRLAALMSLARPGGRRIKLA